MKIRALYENFRNSLLGFGKHSSALYPEIYGSMIDITGGKHNCFDVLDDFEKLFYEKVTIDDFLFNTYKSCFDTTCSEVLAEYEELLELFEYSEFANEDFFLKHKRDFYALKSEIYSLGEILG